MAMIGDGLGLRGSPRWRSCASRSVVSDTVSRHPCLGLQHLRELVLGMHRRARQHIACAYAWLQASVWAAEPCPTGPAVCAAVLRFELRSRLLREDVDLPTRAWGRY